MNTESVFDFENLEIWRKAIEFCDQVISLVENLNTDSKHFRLISQIEASSTSIALNIAEGKGRNSDKEFLQYLYYSRGSLYETISMLIIFQKRAWISNEDMQLMRENATILAKMLNSFINFVKNKIKTPKLNKP